ncbi:MAG TPA: ABC transporter ATP-binding protein [bacterium]|nr:ABC transporter ATP-binding protein [bacterium]
MASALKFEHVSKRYTIGGPLYASLRYDLARAARGLLTGFRAPDTAPRRSKLALDDVSFDVREGESWGIVGPNGAGKTTMLRLLTRISYPTAGSIRVRGRVAALIEVGSGIHPELSARENIWLYGQILGMSKADIARHFDEIVEFAELSEALDTPVKMYSSGMMVRLGFSIASHLNPDIFVCDEALAVGDAVFQAKCVNRMTQLMRDGKTLLFVSHHLPAVEAVCPRAIFLLDGRIQATGATAEAIDAYLAWVDRRQESGMRGNGSQPTGAAVSIEGVTLCDAAGAPRRAFRTGDDIEVRITMRAAKPVPWPALALGITDGRPGPLVLCSMGGNGHRPSVLDGAVTVACRLRGVPLMPRIYQLYFNMDSASDRPPAPGVGWQNIGSFRIAEGPGGQHAVAGTKVASIEAPVHVMNEWTWS